MSRRPNSDERRAQIVQGLLGVMAREGYEGATIQAIARAAKLAPGLVHYHFGNKLQILQELIGTLTAGLEARYRARLAGAQGPEARLFALIDAHVALGDDADPRAVAAWNVVGTEALRHPEVRVLYRGALARSLSELRRLLRVLLKEQARTTTQAGHLAAGLLSAIEGAYRVAAAAPKGLPRGYAAPVLRRMARGLVQSQPRA